MKLMLTEKQIRVLRYFRDFRREKGIAPTLDEAARALGVSKITIHEHPKQLSRQGAVYRDRAKARAVAIQAQVLSRVLGLQKEMGLSLIFIAHDLSVVKHITTRFMVLYLGNVVELANSRDL